MGQPLQPAELVAMLSLRLSMLGLAAAVSLPAAAEEAPKPADAQKVSSERELVVEKDDYELRLSLPTEEDVAAWRLPGFRIALGAGYGFLNGLKPAGDHSGFAFVVRPSMRLDDRWSIAANFAFLAGSSEFSGLRWSATVSPVFHPWRGLALSVGLGYGGNMLSRMVQASWNPQPRTDWSQVPVAGYTLPDNQALSQCTGGAWTSNARAEYLMVVGPVFSMGPFIQADLQVTNCKEPAYATDKETGAQIDVSQWWRQYGGSLGWWFSWR